MPRKKRATTQESAPAAMPEAESTTTALAVHDAPRAIEPGQEPLSSAAEPPASAGEPGVAEAGEAPKQWGDPYKRLFSSAAMGFEMGEHRRFKQRVFKFTEKPEPQIIERLKEEGFTYRPAEKAWTIQANPETRRLSDELTKEFAGPSRSMER